MRGQASVELLVTVGFAVLMLIPLLILVYIHSSSSAEQLAISQAQQTANKLKNMVDLVGAQGPPAKITTNIVIPRRVSTIIIGSAASPPIGREIIFVISTSAGDTEIVATAFYNVTGNLTNYTKSGNYPVEIEAVEDCLGTGNPCVEIRPA